MDSNPSPEAPDTSLLGRIQRHRLMTALFVVSTLAGAVMAALLLPEDIALVRRILGGAISGAGVAFLMTATKMLNS